MLNLTKEVEWTAEVETEKGNYKLEWNLEKLSVHSPRQTRLIDGMGAADVNNLADAMKGIVSMGDDRFPASKA